MPKDYQEVERIVEEFQNKDHIITSDGGLYVAVDAHWLRTTLTTYGNARELQGVEKVANIIRELRYHEDSISHLISRGGIDWQNMQGKMSAFNEALNHIAKVKSELN
jgi:hypothetical protein